MPKPKALHWELAAPMLSLALPIMLEQSLATAAQHLREALMKSARAGDERFWHE